MSTSDLAGSRIALVRLSAIGDVVHVLPVVNSLRAAAPDAHLTWVIQPGPHELVKDHPAVDRFILFERSTGWRAYPRLRRQIRGESFDIVLDLHGYFKAGIVTAMLRAPRKIGLDRARAGDLTWLATNERIAARPLQHVLEQNLEFLDHLQIPRRLEWKLGPTAEEEELYGALLPADDRPTVALVLASSKPEKDWPTERYPVLVDRLSGELGARVILVGGRSPRELAVRDLIASRSAVTPMDFLAWDLRRLVYLISRSNALVSPDTGPLHIGVALGTPSVALMGHTNPAWMGPCRFQELTIDTYFDPGEARIATREYRAGRMKRIGVEQVLERVREAFRLYGV